MTDPETNIAHDLSLRPPRVLVEPGPDHAAATRPFQGIPGVEWTAGGRLWVVWYGGGEGEGTENYVVAVTSDDDGATWSAERLAIDPGPGPVRAFDPCVWRDPADRLWIFWAQSQELWDGRGGVWAIRCDAPDAARPDWTAPRRLFDGVMMNKPVVLSDGTWLAPAAVWGHRGPWRDDMAPLRFSSVYASTDGGETFTRRGGADTPDRAFDEHMVVERRDGSLWMLVRLRIGVAESVSIDGGRTWTPGRPTTLGGPGSRFFVGRLRDGRLLLVNHDPNPESDDRKRRRLRCFLSDDDGAAWRPGLLLDGRDGVSYPDAAQGPDGRVAIVHDRNRQSDREILLSLIAPEDLAAAEPRDPRTRLRLAVSRPA